MELAWEDLHHNGTVGFSRDLYDKYSLAPTVKELWAIAQSRSPVKVEVKQEATVENSDRKPDPASTAEQEKTGTHPDSSDAFPEPRVPYPCFSWLTIKDQTAYMRWLTHKHCNEFFQQLQGHVNCEREEFMKYLQDVARICAEDYNYLSQGAARYSEECLRASLEMVKKYPQVYLIHEMTSITGGKFNPDLSLNLEKQLLVMGHVTMVELHRTLPKNAQLAEDYEPVSAETPPVKKAGLTHTVVSNDPNAEKLYERYEPHVCLTSQAFLRLLNNQGPEYSDQWEMPVWVKMSAEKGSRKEVYIDSPLVNMEMSVREKYRLFHEESVKLVLKRTIPKRAKELLLDKPPPIDSKRSLISFADDDADFEVDLTDLETFGESSLKSEKTKRQKEPRVIETGVKPTFSQPRAVVKKPSSISEAAAEDFIKAKSALAVEEADSSLTDVEYSSKLDCSSVDESEETDLSLRSKEKNVTTETSPQPWTSSSSKKRIQDSSLEVEPRDCLSSGTDSDEERLVIDPTTFPKRSSALTGGIKMKSALCSDPVHDSPRSPSPELIMDVPSSPSPEPIKQARADAASPTARERAKRSARRTSPKGSQDYDQLGQILRMQSAMLKPSHAEVTSPPRGTNLSSPTPPSQSHSQSLVKSCVTSYLGANQGLGQGASACAATAALTAPLDSQTMAQNKRLLSQDLLVGVEDESHYECPEEGNLLYRLYSLQDVLMMVRSSVPLAQDWQFGSEVTPTPVPVHFLPKLEYQLCYGLECLTKDEVCQLWAESQLHPSTVSYVGHIDALTSKLFLTEEISPDRIINVSCGFTPAKSLNILHHLLQKVASLQEGRYLLTHKAGEPFVTILKACEGKKLTRATYDLHRTLGQLPPTPPHGPVPWVPVDPSHPLPFHIKHNRVPCTFPPKWAFQARKNKGKGPTQGPAKKKKKLTKAQHHKAQLKRAANNQTH